MSGSKPRLFKNKYLKTYRCIIDGYNTGWFLVLEIHPVSQGSLCPSLYKETKEMNVWWCSINDAVSIKSIFYVVLLL